MYKSHKDEAIVVKSINYSESDKILTLFGKYIGKFSVIAKGIRKIESKNRGNLQTLFISEVYFLERDSSDLGILKESKLIHASDYSKENLKNVQRVLFMLNKFILFKQPEIEVYERASTLIKKSFTLGNINDFRIFTLRQLGFLGEEGICQRCENQDVEIFVHPKTLEIVCESCFYKMNKHAIRGQEVSEADLKPFSEIISTSAELTIYLDKLINSIAF